MPRAERPLAASSGAGSDLVWNDEPLNRWLAAPQDLIPPQRMDPRVKTARDRADLIAFLKRESLESNN